MSEINNKGIRKVITAASLGTLIEWYDFYIFGSLAVIIGKQLFPADSGASALINTLAIFAAGFIVRPFGAIVFGRLGDVIGRKHTFLLTLVLMGGSTFMIGLIPGFSSIGYFAPALVLLLRLVQGLALGGEYGGAATYVAEHAPAHKKGFYTSWIQTTATLGLFLSLGVIVFLKTFLGAEKFEAWGWRIPFLISIVLVFISFYIRLKMKESPMFEKLKMEGNVSKNPLKESFQKKANLKLVLLALFGAVMGQGVIWYTSQFYAQSFLENTCKIEFNESRYILLWAIALATPFFIVFGSLSDRFGRKWIMLGGMFLAIIFYRPIYQNFLDRSNISVISENIPVLNNELNASTKNKITDTEKNLITTSEVVELANGFSYLKTISEPISFVSENNTVVPSIKYSNIRLPFKTYSWFIFLVFVQILFVTMVYGPIAAFLVDLFPTRIRYTSMSLPYHIGNGVFGGLVPFLATLITSFKGSDALSGLWYPIAVASVCFIIGIIYLDNNKSEKIIIQK